MKYKIIINNNNYDLDLNNEIRILYGNFYLSKGFETYFTENQWYIKNNYKDKVEQYAEVDEEELFNDILKAGKKIYSIVKEDLKPVYDNDVWLYFPSHLIINIDICNKYHKELEPILLEFVQMYNIPISMENFNNTFIDLCSISFLELTNNILLIYVINTIYAKLNTGVENYYKIYNIFSINREDTNEKILTKLADIFNNDYILNFGLNNYKTRLMKIDNLYVNFKYTSNLFTIAWDFLRSMFSTLSFKVEDENGTEYLVFTRCCSCLSTLSEIKEYKITPNKLPNYFNVRCDNCKSIRIANQKKQYEKNLRNTYDYIKENKKYINTTIKKGLALYNKICKLPTNKDKVKLKDLIQIKDQLNIYVPIEKRQ